MKHLFGFLGIISAFAILFFGCDTVESSKKAETQGEWLVKESEIFDGGPGKDGIPALVNPEFDPANQISYLDLEDLVLIAKFGDIIKIYPHPILDWHEIINDGIGNVKFAITYCPLTGSGISWDRVIGGESTTFGVSGLLYNTNLIPYDRKTESNWSQMMLKSINGSLISENVKTYPLIETSWETAKALFPEAQVVTTNTGYSRNYGRYPYGDYKTNNSSLLFPVNHSDSRLSSKERVLGILAGTETKAYRLQDFSGGKVVVDNFGGRRFLIYGNQEKNIITAFDISGLAETIEFTKSTLPLPFILQNNDGKNFDIFGKPQNSGGISLITAKSYIAYWFAWAAFYPTTDLYTE